MASVPVVAPATETDWFPFGSMVTVLLPSFIAETFKPARLFALKSIFPVPVIDTLVLLEMLPVPDVVSPTVLPLMLPPRIMAPFVPDAVKESAAVAVMVLVVVIPPLAESVRLMDEPVAAPFPVNAVESVNVTAPVVLKFTLGVAS